MKRVVYMAIAFVFTATALFAQYTDESVRRANANAAAARSLARQALDAVEDLRQEQDRRQAEANQKAAAAEKEALDQQVAEAQAANDKKRFDRYRRLQAAAVQGNSPSAVGDSPSAENLAALYTQLVQSSFERSLALFPAFSDPEGMQRLAFDAYIQRAIKDPVRRAEFANPYWPEKLMQEFAAKMKIAEGPANQPPAPEAPVKPVPDTFAVLTLTNGRELHDVELKGFSSTSVLVKHRAGKETIAYTLFPPEYQPGLALRKPRPKTEAEKATARELIDADAQRLAETRKQTLESVKISKAAARSEEIAVESALAKHVNAARNRIQKYFMYEYVNGSGPTYVEVEIETTEERMGWGGSYRIRGRAYIAFDYGRAVREFEVETETQNGVVTAKVIRVE